MDNSLCATAHRAISFFFEWLADFGGVSRSDSRVIAKAGRWLYACESRPGVVLEAQPPRLRAIIMNSGVWRMSLYHALMVNQSLHLETAGSLRGRGNLRRC
jgi:hypothetical protein